MASFSTGLDRLSLRHQSPPNGRQIPPVPPRLPARWGLSLVIPAYNEAERIGPTLGEYLAALRQWNHGFEIIVVFDGADGTPDVVSRLGAPEVRLYRYEKKLGRGGAIFEGMRKAVLDVVGYVDADGSVGPGDLIRMLGWIEAGELAVVGSRRLDPSTVVVPEAQLRRFVGWVWHALLRALLGVTIRDVQCGAKLFRREVADFVCRNVVVTNRTFEAGMIYHILRRGIPIREVAVAYRHNFQTRMPIVKAIPVMFLFLLGILLANRPRLRRLLPERMLVGLNQVFSST